MRIAVLGLGFMGATHLRALLKNHDSCVAAVYSSDETKLNGDLTGIQGNLGAPSFCHDFSGLKKFRDWRELLADPSIDAVDLCLPTYLHELVALAALEAGKHVLVEKPLGLDADAMQRMIDYAARRKLILMAAHVLRFFPEYEVLRKQVADGIGQVRTAFFHRRCAAPGWSPWLSDPTKSGGGVFDLLIHDVDLCLHLFGPPQSVSAEGYTDLGRGIDVISANLHYPEISSVNVMGGWRHPRTYPFAMEYTVVGDDATVEYHSGMRPPTRYTAAGEEQKLKLDPHDGYEAEISYFIDCCMEGRQPDRCPPAESRDAVLLMQALLQARQTGEKISWPN